VAQGAGPEFKLQYCKRRNLNPRQGLVVHIYNPSHSEGTDQEDQSLRPKDSTDMWPMSVIPATVESLNRRVEACWAKDMTPLKKITK
jgi:hypothetical protein